MVDTAAERGQSERSRKHNADEDVDSQVAVVISGSRLHRVAWQTALALPAVLRGQPFGPDYDVFKVGGRVFVMTTDVRGIPIVTLKCEAEYASALRRQYATIMAGYHMNKKHRTSVAPGAGISEHLVRELVEDAYDLVVGGLPKWKRAKLTDRIR
jgi:predicted DNA-binding protein (MmcQ/YjbR family)